MIRPKVQLSLRNARAYFREHLSVGDYYSAGQTMTGEWLGHGAERLGLTGPVGEKAFVDLCEGRDPRTGERLTARMNTTRWENEKREPNRRIFYDFTISPPKSISVVALSQDQRIVELHNQAVRVAMNELEAFAGTRVRKSWQDTERETGNIVTACFRHDTSRELDPHLHTHCVVFNATFDSVENRWKALEVSEMYRAQKFAENLYYHELSKGLRTLGYEIENNPRNFEIKGVPASVIDRFSKRHRQIDEETARQIERDGSVGNVEALREHIAHTGRRRKQKNSTADRLRPEWREQMTQEERHALDVMLYRSAGVAAQPDIPGIVTWANTQVFERRAVANDYELMSAALARGRGQDFDLAALRAEIDRREYFRDEGSRRLTSQETLRHEVAVVTAARDGRYMFGPFNAEHQAAADLSPEQRAAVGEILKSRAFITVFRGAAGTGKSHALREVMRGLEANGFPVVVVAPQRQQAGDLTADGMTASTLALVLQKRTLPKHVVVLLDEAGQVGARQMRELATLVDSYDGRLILSGDTRQHGPVEASDILRAIEKHAGIKPAVLRGIHRQNPELATSDSERAFIIGYRCAVKAASDGKAEESFDQLDRLGCIREAPTAVRHHLLAAEYLASLERKEKALVVAQTWDEVTAVNDSIRSALRERGQLGDGTTIKTLRAVDLTEAEKQDARYYRVGQVAYVQKRYGRYARGDCCRVLGATEKGVVLEKNGRRSTMNFKYVGRLVITEEREMEVAPGDRLQLKFNGKSRDGRSLANGELVTVRKVGTDGSIEVEDNRGQPKTLSSNQRLFNRGYAVTSYGSQGKTVDAVLFADSGCRAATTSEQWYVTISRGRKRVAVFTENKADLRAAVVRSGQKDLALDLNADPTAAARAHAEHIRRSLEHAERYRRFHALIAMQQRQSQGMRIH